uniref:RanBD1 domain-containing protein n=1 Tax=Davidia involucrata TaxID=16924 RepID=A0A5B6ZHX1_DAVIN
MMMKGTKRFAVSDSKPETNDSAFQSKRIMAGSLFDVHRAESSQQQLMATPPLDMRQAESSRQHVRALNTQFASWIQTQLQNHPDELWEDGVQDYLAHASNIMEKFSDVVNWLKANAVKGESFSAVGSHVAQKKFVFESKENETKLFQEKRGIAPAGTNASFTTSWNSGFLFNNQTPFSFGSQNSVPLNRDASNDVDGEDDVERPSSPSVKKTEEKGIIVVHEVKCKLYVKSSDPADKDAWKDKGTGQLSIKCKEGVSKGTKESKPTILVRNDVGKVLLNALLYPGIKTNVQKNSIVAIFHTSGENDGGDNNNVVARTFLLRTKSEEERNKLAAAIQEYAPAA